MPAPQAPEATEPVAIGDVDLLQAKQSLRAGDLGRRRGRSTDAIKHYDLALGAGNAAPQLAVPAHAGMSRALLQLDELDQALHHAEMALRLSLSAGRDELELLARLAMGIVTCDLTRFEDALAHLGRASDLAESLGNDASRSEALLHLGYTRSDMNEERHAIGLLTRALQLAQRASVPHIEALSLMGLGHVHSKLGNKQEALNLYLRAKPMLEDTKDSFGMASLATGMGYLYSELGDYETAEVYYSEAIALNDVVGSRWGRAANLVHLARVHGALERHERAVTAYRAAIADLVTFPEQGMAATIYAELASVLDRLGLDGDSSDAYARALSRTRFDQRGTAEVLNELGKIDLRRGRLERARARFSDALELSRRTDSPFAEIQALFGLGRVELAEGRLGEALARVETALDLFEELRAGISSYRLRSSYLAASREIHALHVDILMTLHERQPGAGFDRKAFLAAEVAKARSLLDRLSSGRPESTPAAETELVERARALEGEIARRAARWRGQRTATRSSVELPSDLGRLILELEQVEAVLRSRSAEHFSSASLAGVEELQRDVLDERTALLSYFLGPNASYLWVLTPSRLTAHPLPPEGVVEETASRVKELLATGGRERGGTARERRERMIAAERSYWLTASELSESILGPALQELGTERLLVAADGILHQLPFSPLPLPGAPGRAVLERYEVVRVPSASSFQAIVRRSEARREGQNKLAVLADPVFDDRDPRVAEARRSDGISLAKANLDRRRDGAAAPGAGAAMPRLLSSREEARAILSLVPPGQRLEALGFTASRDLVTSGRLASYDVLHFATHGVLSLERPELSGLALSLVDARGRPQNGYVRLYDIHKLELPVRLLVLSACRTALGREIGGEGIDGLVGGFLAAGAGGVVASYWDVEDEATSELMRLFYKGLFSERLSAPAALRKAQNGLLETPRWRSPYYFGAFELHGYWK